MDLFCVGEKCAGVFGVGSLEGNRGSGQGGGRLCGHVGSGMGGVDLVGRTGGGHVLRPLPAVVVGAAVADLDVEDVRLGVSMDQVVGTPPDGGQSVTELFLRLKPGAELHHPPRDSGQRVGKREPKLHVVPGVEVSSGEINLFPHRSINPSKTRQITWSEAHGEGHTPLSLPSLRAESPRQVTRWLGGSFPDLWASKKSNDLVRASPRSVATQDFCRRRKGISARRSSVFEAILERWEKSIAVRLSLLRLTQGWISHSYIEERPKQKQKQNENGDSWRIPCMR
ncbi:hypothetical protein GW17_00040745 [Ensete ventricosum]|nr:hypothetical protein GW17_00040745 [Ensete ventricosum]